MPSPHTVSLLLLSSGAACLTGGAFVLVGLGWALLVLGALLIAADLLVGR